MVQKKLLQQAARLQGVAVMGGFVVSLEQAQKGVLDAEGDERMQKSPTLLETLDEIRQSRRASSGG